MGADAARLLRERIAAAGEDLPLDAEAVFPEGGGFFESRAAAARAKLLGKLRPVLARALEAGEQVRYAARAVQYFPLEFVFSGYAVAQASNFAALVLTDRRLLLVSVRGRGQPRDIKNQIRLAEIHSSRKRLGRHFELRLADGKKLAFMGLRGADARVLGAALPRAEGKPRPASARPASLEHLCPSCLRHVPGPVGASPSCPNPACRIPFRDARRAARLSALVPGVGDLYLRHHLFGSLEFAGSMLALGAALVLGLRAAVLGEEMAPVLLLAGLLVVLPRVVDYFLTLHMGRKGLVPLALTPVPGGARNLPSFPAWAYALFAAGLAGAGGAAVAAAGWARDELPLVEARREAERGDFEKALSRYASARSAGSLDATQQARLVLALYRSGDLKGAGEVLSDLGGRKVDADLAARVNGEIERHRKAFQDLAQGRVALVKGDEAAGWPAVDRALSVFRVVKRPVLPQSRGEVLADLAGELLAPPVEPAQLQAAERLLARAGSEAPEPRRAVARAAALSLRGRGPDAAAALAGVGVGSLPTSWRLLALETRARLAESAAERQALAQAARELALGDGDEEAALRREALLAPPAPAQPTKSRPEKRKRRGRSR